MMMAKKRGMSHVQQTVTYMRRKLSGNNATIWQGADGRVLQSDSLSVMKHGGSVHARATFSGNKVAEDDCGRWYEIVISDGRSNVSVSTSVESEQ